MRKKDTSDVLASFAAVIGDALAVLGGFMLATWLRFDVGWVVELFPVTRGRMEGLYAHYLAGAALATVAVLLVFRALQLYVRPQLGRFENKIPRLVRACGLGVLVTTVVAFALQNEAEYSRLVLGFSLVTITALVLLERYICFRIELHNARHSQGVNRVLILGTDSVAARIKRGLENEPKLRSRVVGFLRTDLGEVDPAVPCELIRGTVAELAAIQKEYGPLDQIILASSSLPHDRVVELILFCERNLITFNIVPDLFRILTGTVAVQAIDDIPLLGVSQLPLDYFWNRMLKRVEDIVGSLVGLLVSAPVIAVAAVLIKRSSPGPVFYRQERCGENGRRFNLYKLRTMRVDAEAESGPVWASKDDPRRTRIGSVLRRYNLDELPQFWNVLRGDMSLVGPRPERPHFVEQFREDVARYMWRHISKPGLTGWAQVNGLRGNTSIEDRVKYDLYYLENWSLAFDFKILLQTFFARENAY